MAPRSWSQTRTRTDRVRQAPVVRHGPYNVVRRGPWGLALIDTHMQVHAHLCQDSCSAQHSPTAVHALGLGKPEGAGQ